MLNLFKTLMSGAGARAEAKLKDHYAVDLIGQKIREAEASLSAAKETLASIILRERAQKRSVETLNGQIRDLEERTRQALDAGDKKHAHDGAAAIAELENEREVRVVTHRSLEEKIKRMRLSIEKAHRRVVDLKQGQITAQAIDAERKAQRKLNRSIGNTTPIREAEDLIEQVIARDDPFEESGILDEIEAELSHDGVKDRMAAAGFGPQDKVRADDVLARLKGKAEKAPEAKAGETAA